MLDENDTPTQTEDQIEARTSSESADPGGSADTTDTAAAPAKKTVKKAAKKTAKKATAKKATKKVAQPADEESATAADSSEGQEPAKKAATKKTAAKKAAAKTAKSATAKKTAKKAAEKVGTGGSEDASDADSGDSASAPSLLFRPPETKVTPARKKAQAKDQSTEQADTQADTQEDAGDSESGAGAGSEDDDTGDDQQGGRRRRRRGGRRRRRGGGGDDGDGANADSDSDAEDESGGTSASKDADASGAKSGTKSEQGGGKTQQGGGKGQQGGGKGQQGGGKGQQGGGKGQQGGGKDDDAADADSGTTRRRRRRRRAGEDGDGGPDDPQNTVTRVRKPRSAEDEITSLQGSTRLEAKKQRRREGREAGRRRAPIVSEAEFLARREAVDRVMVIRQRPNLTQIAVLEDKVLVEHYVARESQSSLIGNVYLGRVQNVLPSMEAAFIDIGKGRNAVLYAGEVNWDSLGAGNGPRKIEQVLKSGQSILVQVTKDPIGHKGARLTSQVSLPGRFLVYVPDGNTSGISRKLPDTERTRLKNVLKEIVPDTAGVIVRTAAEGASEDELTRDVERLTARWSDIEAKVEKTSDKGGGSPQLLYGEPDLTLKVVRDLFTEDFGKLVVSGADAWDMVDGYVKHVAPDLEERLERYDENDAGEDVFAAYRIDEQIAKGLDRKVWLPSGGSLIFDRTEAMTVVDVNTGKFTGSGGNLEETVTKNNLEAAEEIVRQLRLRDIGGIIVVDFIDMVLESNRDLVLRRLVECLGRDRTRHQVAEVTSLGLVQMTRKRIGTGLLEAFSESCEHCQGRGLLVHHEPVEPKRKQDDEPRRGRRGRRGGSSGGSDGDGSGSAPKTPPSPKDLAAMARHEPKPSSDTSDTSDTAPDSQEEPTSDTAPDAAPDAAPDSTQESAGVTPETGADESETAPAAEVPAAADVPDQPAGEDQQAAEQPPPPAGPRLVTSSRRMARRPAGPPAGTAAQTETPPEKPAQPTDGPSETNPDAVAPSGDSEPVSTDAVAEAALAESAGDENGVDHEPTPEPSSEPSPEPNAGPSADGDSAEPDESGHSAGLENPDGAGEASDTPSAGSTDGNGSRFHVPIKKKGSRRR